MRRPEDKALRELLAVSDQLSGKKAKAKQVDGVKNIIKKLTAESE